MPGEEAGDEPKYLNSPETPIYRKGHTLYGFHQARSAMQDGRESIVVEGYTDLLALWQVGIRDVAATLGTALTENHFDLLNRVSDSVYLAFDADRAGMDAALRTVDFWGRFRLDIFVVMLPEGEDPASVVKKGGAQAFDEMKGRAEGLFDFAVRKTIEGFDTTNPMGSRRAMEACVAILSKVSSEEMKPLKNDLVRKIGGWLDMPPEEVILRAEFDSLTQRMVEDIADEGLRGKVSRLLMESPPECKPGFEDTVFDRLEYLFYKRRKHQVELDIGRTNKKLEPKKYESLCGQLLEIEQVMKELFPYDHG
jgi:DNA primase